MRTLTVLIITLTLLSGCQEIEQANVATKQANVANVQAQTRIAALAELDRVAKLERDAAEVVIANPDSTTEQRDEAKARLAGVLEAQAKGKKDAEDAAAKAAALREEAEVKQMLAHGAIDDYKRTGDGILSLGPDPYSTLAKIGLALAAGVAGLFIKKSNDKEKKIEEGKAELAEQKAGSANAIKSVDMLFEMTGIDLKKTMPGLNMSYGDFLRKIQSTEGRAVVDEGQGKQVR